MKHILLILLGGSAALSVGNHHHLHFKSRVVDRTDGVHDKNPRGNLETGTGSSPIADSVIGTITATTTLTSVVYYTSTIFDTALSTNLGVTTKFVTSMVTRDSIDVATVTDYVTSTKIVKRFQENSSTLPTAITTPTTIQSLETPRSDPEDVVMLPKRDVTSFIYYDITTVWMTRSSTVFETSTLVSEVNAISTQFGTITSTLFNNAKSTTTVVSTVVQTSTEVITSTPGPSVETSLIESTATNTIASHQSSESATSTATIDDKSVNNLLVATSTSMTMSTNNTSSSDSSTATSTSSTSSNSASTSSAPTSFSSTSSIPTNPTLNGATPTSSDTSASGSSGQGTLSTGAKAGIGTGAAAGGLALLGVMVFYALGKRRRPESPLPDENMVITFAPPEPPRRYSHLDSPAVPYPERAAALAHSMQTMSQPASTHDIPGYPQPGTFSPPSRSVSPSVYSEPIIDVTDENMGWYMEPNTEHQDISRRQSDELHLYL
ncbi:hypothetical protein F5Y10DRAFT_272857 [Nemania abortiva]|nr:hypothetical protein F5Y10DRAFT_272857 [Nemania abortiva]